MPGLADYKLPADRWFGKMIMSLTNNATVASTPIEVEVARAIPPIVETARLHRGAGQSGEADRLYRTAAELARYLIAWCEEHQDQHQPSGNDGDDKPKEAPAVDRRWAFIKKEDKGAPPAAPLPAGPLS